MVFGTVVFLLGLLVSITVHELGHMVVARRAGGRVSEFMVGFGPTLVKFSRNGTRYGLKLFPLGGYVRILGMRPPGPGDSNVDPHPDVPGRDFYLLPVARRVVTLLAGPAANLALAAVLLLFVLSVLGIPASSTRVGSVSACLSAPCAPGEAVSPAAAAGFRSGDRVLAVDGVPIDEWADLTAVLGTRPAGSTVRVEVLRGDARVDLFPVLAENPNRPGVGFLGVSSQMSLQRQPPGRVPAILWAQVREVTGAVVGFPVAVFRTFDGTLRGEPRPVDSPIGLVGAGRLGAELGAGEEIAAHRLGQMLALLAGLNVSLAVFNLIPLLPLDGGHVLVNVVEAARSAVARRRGRPDPGPLDPRRLALVTHVVFAFFITASLLLLFADLVNPVRFR